MQCRSPFVGAPYSRQFPDLQLSFWSVAINIEKSVHLGGLTAEAAAAAAATLAAHHTSPLNSLATEENGARQPRE